MIASHYAEPVERIVTNVAALRLGPSDEYEIVQQLDGGERFLMLDDTLGWAWGYAGDERRVGYLRSEALSSQRM